MSLSDKQKKKLDGSFNKAAVSAMTEKEFVKKYAGKLPLQIDMQDAIKYLDIKPDKSKSYASTTTKDDKK